MRVSLAELDLELDPAEEVRRRVEDESVDAGLETRQEVGDPPVDVGLPLGDQLLAAVQLDTDVLGGRPCSVSSTWVERSCRESFRLAAMLARDLVLVGADEVPVANDLLAADDQPVDAMRAREDEPRNRVGGPAELETVRPPDGKVGALARLQ